jgi:hypothetical protein
MLLAMAACNMPGSAPGATATPDGLSVVSLSSTQTALAGQPSPSEQASTAPATSTELPSATPAPAIASATATLPVGFIASETPTPTLEPVFALAMKDTNCRIGPAGNYDLVVTFKTGTKLEVIATDLGSGFIYVKNPDKPGEGCYILANNVKVSGDPAVLPQYTPLPSPTLSPNVTITFKKFDICRGNVFALFVVTNTGGVPFRSAYVRVSELKSGDVEEQTLNAFDLWTGCIIAKNIAPLDPGATGYLTSAMFKKNPSGGNLRAAFQVCTEKDLKGFCVTVSIIPKP